MGFLANLICEVALQVSKHQICLIPKSTLVSWRLFRSFCTLVFLEFSSKEAKLFWRGAVVGEWGAELEVEVFVFGISESDKCLWILAVVSGSDTGDVGRGSCSALDKD